MGELFCFFFLFHRLLEMRRTGLVKKDKVIMSFYLKLLHLLLEFPDAFTALPGNISYTFSLLVTFCVMLVLIKTNQNNGHENQLNVEITN